MFIKAQHIYASLRCITIYKIGNYLLLLGTYYWSIIFKRVHYKALPAFLSVEPTNTCNLACPECPTGLKIGNTPKGFINLADVKKIATNARSIISANIFFQGEPFLHPSACEIIRIYSQAKVYTIVSTNAHFISSDKALEIVKSGLHKLIISFDGFDQESYEKYRINGNFQTVIESIKLLVKAKRETASILPYIELQTLLFSTTEHKKEEIRKQALVLGVDGIVFKTAQFYDLKNKKNLIPSEKNSRYIRRKDGNYQIKNNLKSHCWRVWSGRVITWNGTVIPCCFDKNWDFKLSNINDCVINYNPPKYLDFVKKVFKNRSSIEICRNCTEGLKK